MGAGLGAGMFWTSASQSAWSVALPTGRGPEVCRLPAVQRHPRADHLGAPLDVRAFGAPLDVRAYGAPLDVRAYGALGNGARDDTAAIQRALNALQPGQWLVFPPGRYLHATRLVVAQQGATISGYGATLHATNPADQALLIQASGVRVQGFTMTAVTDRRRVAPWESRLAIWRDGEQRAPLTDIELRDNRIIESGAPGTPGANSSSSAAIFVHGVHGFVVAGNEVRRSLSDGIHVTGGARHGRVVGNTVRESGDDMVAVVSYLVQGDEKTDPPERIAAELQQRRERELVQDVLIADNDVAGQYWGRGISVVGGERVTIARNRIDATTHAAGIYIAREQGWGSFGVRQVVVAGNHISRVQTTRPAYTVLDAPQRWQRTGHGAVELVAHVFDDEARWPLLRSALTVEQVGVWNNLIEDAATAGVRVGYGWGRPAYPGWRGPGLGGALRRYSGAAIRAVQLRDNRLLRVQAGGIEVLNGHDVSARMACSGNTLDGQPLSPPGCAATVAAEMPVITGAAMTCGA